MLIWLTNLPLICWMESATVASAESVRAASTRVADGREFEQLSSATAKLGDELFSTPPPWGEGGFEPVRSTKLHLHPLVSGLYLCPQ